MELLMVVFILGILAGVVTVNVTGLVGRGEKEAYATDSRTIQLAVSTFYTDNHAYSSNGGWNEAGNHTSVHNFPLGNGTVNAPYLYLGNLVVLDGLEVSEIWSGPGVYATEADIERSAIWMGLLTNAPGEGDVMGVGPDVPPGDDNSPLEGEHGLYLNPLPKSCSVKNQSTAIGSYTWIVAVQGRVYGVFPYDIDGDGVNEWYAGFGGWYP